MNIESIITIVREASSLMVNDVFDIVQKDGYANIVTTSDTAVQNFLCDKFSKLIPGSGFICEENDIKNISHEYTWIIDPIDGTANYSRGIDNCAICVGLRQGDEMLMGVVFIPRTDEMFYAEKGKGAFMNGKPIHVSDRPFANSVMCTALPVYHKEHSSVCSDIIEEVFLKCNDIRRFGACAPELCYLAMGRVELYFEYILSPWDFAAASLIVTEAGGVISSLDGTPLSCIAPTGVIAANTMQNYNELQSIVKNAIA